VSAADVPLTARVKTPGDTVAGTDRTTVWALPAATVNGEAGDVVAPAGSPETVIVIESLNPFWLVVYTAKVELEPPPLTVIAAGDSVRPKSCSERTVKARFAECVRPADVPRAAMVKSPAGIVPGMEKARIWLLPAGMLNGAAGDVVTPAGNPEKVITTGSVNPF
jgi:hypothetical protein